MTTEEKNALAKEYELKNRMLPENVPAQIIIVQNAFEAGLTHRDAEVSDFVEALRNLYNADPHDQTWNRSAAMDAANRLLSKYPVNKEGNG